MGLLGGLFKKEKHKGYFEIKISSITRLNNAAVKVNFDVPDKLSAKFSYTPGQYINILKEIKGKEQRRSYSICSAKDEPLSIGVKYVENGIVSNWFVNEAKEGDILYLSSPQGNFTIPTGANTIVTIAAGSGITPILSILKSKTKDQRFKLLFGNKSQEETMFLNEISDISELQTNLFYSRIKEPGAQEGRIDKSSLTDFIKADLSFLQSDAFLICGPEEMILGCIEALEFFGVAKNKIIYELFTTPISLGVEAKKESYSGSAEVTVILDDEDFQFTIEDGSRSILDAVEEEGMDAPYSCRGGVCCSCKAKVLEGSADMKLNYSLTDDEVKEGYILTCQAFPTSDSLKISFDE